MACPDTGPDSVDWLRGGLGRYRSVSDAGCIRVFKARAAAATKGLLAPELTSPPDL